LWGCGHPSAMPNLATHPARSPRDPRKGYKGEIPYSTLEKVTCWNPDINRKAFYQEGFQKFSNIPVDKSLEVSDRIRAEIQGPGDLDALRSIYAQIIDGKGKIHIETRLLRLLRRKMNTVFTRLINEAAEELDSEALESLIIEAESDPLLAAHVSAANLAEFKAKLPEVRKMEVVKQRDLLDSNCVRKTSSVVAKRRSTVANKLQGGLLAAGIKGWDFTTFNAETGRLRIVKEVAFERRKSMYQAEAPVAEFADPDEAEGILSEVLMIWQIFKVPIEVVQAHKQGYAVKGIDGGEHEEWLQKLAVARTLKLVDALADLGIPRDMMTPQVHIIEASSCMQYVDFALDFKFISFSHLAGVIDFIKELRFQKRAFSKDGIDAPTAQFAAQDTARAMLVEVYKVWSVYKCDMDIVVHRPPRDWAGDDEHDVWYEELLTNRGRIVAQELVAMGIPEGRLNTQIGVGEGPDRGAGMHFELLREMRTPAAAGSPPEPAPEMLLVDGCAPFEFNGRYKPAGTANGKPKYRHEKGGKETITCGADGVWYLCYNHDIKRGFFKSNDLGGSERWTPVQTGADNALLPVVVFAPKEEVPSTRRRGKSMAMTKTVSICTSATGKPDSATPASERKRGTACPTPQRRSGVEAFLSDTDDDESAEEDSDEEEQGELDAGDTF